MQERATSEHARQAALAIVDTWAKALAGSDVDTIVGLYAPNATFIGTSSKAVVKGAAGIRAYFEGAVRSIGRADVAIMDTHATAIDDRTAVVMALDRIVGTQATLSGRLTFVVARRGEAWKIVSFHRSAMPS